MSLREFLDGECGQNPVLKVASHFTRDTTYLDQASSRHHQFDINSARQDAALLPPTTFRMDSLLQELQTMGNHSKAPIQASPIAELAIHPEWANEFFRSEQLAQDSGQESWVGDYMSKELELNPIWDQEQEYAVTGGAPRMPEYIGLGYTPLINQHPTLESHSSAKELLDDAKWTTDYNTCDDTQRLDKTELMATAEEFLKSVSDPKIKATEFMSFVEQLSTGEIGADGRKVDPDTTSQQWASEYESESSMRGTSRNANWADEFVTGAEGAIGGSTTEEQSKEEFWQRLNEEWEKLNHDNSPTHPWLTDPSASKVNEPYQFSDENAFNDVEDPFEEGKRKLLAGEIPTAALCFEAAVLKQPDHVESWAHLGTTQALNEQDVLSISALNKCLELQPNNLSALMSLATSLTNESFHLQACNALKRWLKYNNTYAHLISENLGDTLPQTTSMLPPDELLKVQRLFIQAARINLSTGVDPDVQCGLGILFSLGSDYDKAADCFQAALGVNPENPLMWNRLGATLANGGKSTEAIGAYRRALELSPGYVRTRYNLGIACVNLGAYREAAEHFLTSLNMQADGKTAEVKQTSSNMSDSIWSSLRRSLHLMDLTHLTHFVDTRDLGGLNREFNLTS